MTGGDLYTNVSKKIMNKSWRWWIHYYGYSTTYEDSIASPFKYCLYLILNRVVDEKIRFLFPGVPETYFDFETVADEKFEKQKRSGRFSDIDFISSDFIGYSITMYYKTYKYHKSKTVYVGGDLKKKFIEKINNGEKFYTTKQLTLNDFLPEVYSKFHKVPKAVLKELIKMGFRRMYTAVKAGCSISIQYNMEKRFIFHIGGVYTDPEKHIEHYSRTWSRKLRKIYYWNNKDYDGFGYIGLSEELMKDWSDANKSARVRTKFNRVMAYKIQEELYYKNKKVYIFRIKIRKFKGWTAWFDKLLTHDVKYVGYSLDRKFYPATITWLQLAKTYEKGSN